jgi:hypothetical protein
MTFSSAASARDRLHTLYDLSQWTSALRAARSTISSRTGVSRLGIDWAAEIGGNKYTPFRPECLIPSEADFWYGPTCDLAGRAALVMGFGRRPRCKPLRLDGPSSETHHMSGSDRGYPQQPRLGEITAGVTYDVLGAGWNLMVALFHRLGDAVSRGGGSPFSAGPWTLGEVRQILRDRIPPSVEAFEHARPAWRPSNSSQRQHIICDARCIFTDKHRLPATSDLMSAAPSANPRAARYLNSPTSLC